MADLSEANARLYDALLDGDHSALARVITKIENRTPGHRELLAALHAETGGAAVVGITGSPGTGKSTLVDALTKQYREQGETVGIIAVDPSSPYTGGAVLGDRIRMSSTAGDMDVFVRSMSARGRLGGLSMATADAVKALDAFGKDRIIIETVGAGQNEVDIVETAETVVVVVQPGSGDDVQLLKAGILEIGDLFVVNKADMDAAAGTVADLETMIHMAAEPTPGLSTGHHAPESAAPETETAVKDWTPPVIETVATSGEGVDDLRTALEDHREYLVDSGKHAERRRQRAETEIRRLLRADLGRIADEVLDSHGGIETIAASVADRETDPYTIVGTLTTPLESALEASGARLSESESTGTEK